MSIKEDKVKYSCHLENSTTKKMMKESIVILFHSIVVIEGRK